jgi:hypothetical protein
VTGPAVDQYVGTGKGVWGNELQYWFWPSGSPLLSCPRREEKAVQSPDGALVGRPEDVGFWKLSGKTGRRQRRQRSIRWSMRGRGTSLTCRRDASSGIVHVYLLM